jgi:PASTA domain/Putative Ig domain
MMLRMISSNEWEVSFALFVFAQVVRFLPSVTKVRRPSLSRSETMPEQVTVPADLVGLTQSEAEAKLNSAGLVAGTLPRVGSATVPTGRVISADPAAGKSVDRGSAVNLEVSSGPEQVKVPNVVGLTLAAAKKRLKGAGLVGFRDKRRVSSQNPDAGTLVSPTSQVELEVVSSASWPTVVFSLFGIIVFGLIALGVFQNGGVFLRSLANKDIARGLITFLIAIVTVGIAIILAVSTLYTAGDEGGPSFDRGKQILTILIGVLGTIVGFYFGSAPAVTQPLAITSTTLPDGFTNTAYSATLQFTGGTPPVNWSVVTPSALPAGLTLDDASGTISGKPTAASPKTPYTFKVTDSAAPAASVTAEIPLEIKIKK